MDGGRVRGERVGMTVIRRGPTSRRSGRERSAAPAGRQMAHAFKEGGSRVIDRLEPYDGVVRLAVTQDGRARLGDEPGMIRRFAAAGRPCEHAWRGCSRRGTCFRARCRSTDARRQHARAPRRRPRATVRLTRRLPAWPDAPSRCRRSGRSGTAGIRARR